MTAAKAFTIGKREDGGALRRFTTPKPKGARVVLTPTHPANVEGRTIFPSRRFHASEVQRVLKSGANASKIGKTVMKGKWRGYPIFTLTLEERATCPRACQQWASCYGNNMHMAQRIVSDRWFDGVLRKELEALQAQHPGGFVVRLHVLGDFRNAEYAVLWQNALDAFPALRVFGYTAHPPESEVGSILLRMATSQWERFAVRFSGAGFEELGAEVVDEASDTKHLICPAQTGKTDCCATCALCWQSERTIAFLRH